MATLAPPVDVAAVARYFADFPPFRRHGIRRAPRLRVGMADLRGHEWHEAVPGRKELAQALEALESSYFAMLAGTDGARKRVLWPLRSANPRCSSAGITAAAGRSDAPGRPAATVGREGASCT